VHRAAGQVLEATGDDQLLALGLMPLEQYLDRFRRIVLLAAAVHDLGKANDHFQGMIQNSTDREGKPQGLRHEWVTVLMLEQPAPRAWLLPAVGGSETDWQIVIWSVAGHPPAYNRPSPPERVQGAGREIELLMEHPDYRRALDFLKEAFSLNEPPPPTPAKK